MNIKSKFFVEAGTLYHGEIIHATVVAAVVFPTWLGGTEQVNYNSLAEARADIDAHVVEPVLLSCSQISTQSQN